MERERKQSSGRVRAPMGKVAPPDSRRLSCELAGQPARQEAAHWRQDAAGQPGASANKLALTSHISRPEDRRHEDTTTTPRRYEDAERCGCHRLSVTAASKFVSTRFPAQTGPLGRPKGTRRTTAERKRPRASQAPRGDREPPSS